MAGQCGIQLSITSTLLIVTTMVPLASCLTQLASFTVQPDFTFVLVPQIDLSTTDHVLLQVKGSKLQRVLLTHTNALALTDGLMSLQSFYTYFRVEELSEVRTIMGSCYDSLRCAYSDQNTTFDVVRNNVYHQFWFSWSGSTVTVGEGWTVGRHVMASWTDATLSPVRYLALGNTGPATSYWQVVINRECPEALPGECGEGWTKQGTRCYKSFHVLRTHDEARDLCHQENADLFTPDTSAEESFVRSTFISSTLQPYHLGLQRYEYASLDGQEMTWSSWADLEPDQKSVSTDSCLTLVLNTGIYSLADTLCTDTLPYACQKLDLLQHQAAYQQCAGAYGAKLALLNSQAQYDFMATISSEARFWIAYKYNIKVLYNDTIQSWKESWSDDPSPTQHCATFKSIGSWVPQDCSVKAGYICERPVQPGPVCDTPRYPAADCQCYHRSADSMTWPDSLAYCQALGGTLAITPNNNTLMTLREAYGDPESWIGASDGYTEGVWRWINTATIASWNRWRPLVPYGDQYRNCMVLNFGGLRFGTDYDGFMYDDRCAYTKPAICMEWIESLMACNLSSDGCLQSLRNVEWDEYLVQDGVYENSTSDSGLTVIVSSADLCINTCVTRIEAKCFGINYHAESGNCTLLFKTHDNHVLINMTGNQYWYRSLKVRDFATDYCFEDGGLTQSLQAAVNTCTSLDKQLLDFKHPDEDTFYQTVVSNQLGISGKSIWLGLADPDQSAVYRWQDGSVSAWHKWHIYQPKANPDKLCVSRARVGGVYGWNQEPCDLNGTSSLHAVCFNQSGVNCSSATELGNASRQADLTTFTVTYVCDYPMVFSDSHYVKHIDCKCQPPITLSVVNDTCQELLCNSTVDDAFTSNITSRTVNSTATYTCSQAFHTFIDQKVLKQAVCRINDTLPEVRSAFWDLEVNGTECFELICSMSSLPLIENSSIVGNNVTSVGGQMTLACDLGYGQSMGGVTQTLECVAVQEGNIMNAQWNASLDNCTVLECAEPSNLTYGSYNVSTLTYNSTLVYTCDTGYILPDGNTTYTQTCTVAPASPVLAVWEPAPPPVQCMVLECSEPSNLTHGSYNVSTLTYNSTLVYTCDAGYILPDGNTTYTQTCTVAPAAPALAVWEPATAPVQCIEIPTTENPTTTEEATSQGMSTSPGSSALGSTEFMTTTPSSMYPFVSTVYTTTDTNFVITSPKPILTTAEKDTPETSSFHHLLSSTTTSRTTSTTVPPVKYCQPPVKLPHTTVSLNSLKVGGRATYMALTGYTFPDLTWIRTAQCTSTGNWSATPQTPTRIMCPHLSPVANALVHGSSRAFGAQVQYQCASGLLFPSGLSQLTIECGLGGQWSQAPQQCLGQCGPVPYVANASLMSAGHVVGGQATLRCHWGFLFEDGRKEHTIDCLPDWQWQHIGPCYQTSCVGLSPPNHGSLSTLIALSGTEVLVQCDVGYRFPDGSTQVALFCDENQLWNNTYGQCLIIDCGPIPSVVHSVQEGSDTEYNATVTFTCEPGYRHEDGYTAKTIVCNDQAVWSTQSMSCGLYRCPPVPAVPEAWPDQTLALAGTVVRYQCHSGYVLPASAPSYTITCSAQQWNHSATAACTAVHCPPFPAAAPVVLSSPITEYGVWVNVTCVEGYTTHQGLYDSMTCQANTTWSLTPDVCHLVECGAAPVVHNAVRNTSYTQYYGSEVTYTCLSGYWFTRHVFSATLNCTAQGTWSPSLDHCKAVHCPNISTWDDKEVDLSGLSPGDTVNMSCAEDRMLPSRQSFLVAKCTDEGEWQPAIPNCIELVPFNDFEPVPEEADNAALIGTIACGTIGVVALLIFLSDLPHLFAAGKMITNNIKSLKSRTNKRKQRVTTSHQ